MLKSFDFVSNEWLSKNISDEQLLTEEKSIAAEFVRLSPTSGGMVCPVCESGNAERFAAMGGLDYLRCKDCFTVFAPAGAETVDSYQAWTPLVNFRRTEKFQSRTAEIRANMWDELLFWINFRCVRYLGNRAGFRVLDWGNFFSNLSDMIQKARFCGEYSRKSDVLGDRGDLSSGFDVILYIDQLRHEMRAYELLRSFFEKLDDNGLLILSTRVSSGLDILTLKGEIDNVYPYEHSLLPSLKGLELLLRRVGFELLEISTPGTMDIMNVMKKRETLRGSNLFLEYLLDNATPAVLDELQRFLQKNGLSSHARIVARKS